MADLTASDVALMTKNGNDGFLEGNGIIILILFFLIFGFGGNGFGSKTSDTVTTAELYSGLGSQDLKGEVRNGFDVATNNAFNTQKEILQNRYDNQLGIQSISSQMAQCCCNMEKTVIQENQATRDAIADLKISELADKLSLARNQVSNLEQSQYILGSLGQYYQNPPYCGCGCN